MRAVQILNDRVVDSNEPKKVDMDVLLFLGKTIY